jgi:putative SOS response-associated peptidase YedK
MCGRYYMDDSVLPVISGLARQDDPGSLKNWPVKDICPTDMAPVLTGEKEGLKVNLQHWGYPGFKKGQTIFNARAESVLEKKMFQSGILHHRTVIPCTRFYEWNGNREKVEFYRGDSPVVFMAGFSDSYPDGSHYIILTTKANASVTGTHDRMPLILEEQEVRDWILNEEKTGTILKKVPALIQKRMEYEQETLF